MWLHHKIAIAREAHSITEDTDAKVHIIATKAINLFWVRMAMGKKITIPTIDTIVNIKNLPVLLIIIPPQGNIILHLQACKPPSSKPNMFSTCLVFVYQKTPLRVFLLSTELDIHAVRHLTHLQHFPNRGA